MRHLWGRWEDKETGAKTIGERVVGKLIVQERRCQRCNQVQMRMEEVSL